MKFDLFIWEMFQEYSRKMLKFQKLRTFEAQSIFASSYKKKCVYLLTYCISLDLGRLFGFNFQSLISESVTGIMWSNFNIV